MRGARPEYDEPSARTVDATDIGSQHPARYGQNDCEIALNRKNALFAGHDQGAENWACIASLIETCKLHGVDPQAYFADVLTKLVNLWPASRLDELMPWAWAAERSSNKLAA
jgi:IS66 C-terminal element